MLVSDDTSENVTDILMFLAKPVGSVGLKVAQMTDLFLISVATLFFEPAIQCLEDIPYLHLFLSAVVENDVVE